MARGIIIAIMERYENLLIESIQQLTRLGCTLPFELWQIGKEITDEARARLDELVSAGVRISFKNVTDYTEDSEHWKGYQIKAFILKHTDYDEVVLCDCDVLFSMDPTMLFEDPGYIGTGTYFFRDYEHHQPRGIEELRDRVQFIRSLLPTPPVGFPVEWAFIYGNSYDGRTHRWYYQESGVVLMDRRRHRDTVEAIYKLNDDHKNTYKYVLGDKETFWLACLMAGKKFCMNGPAGYNHRLDPSRISCKYLGRDCVLTHKYNGQFCFSQKGYPLA